MSRLKILIVDDEQEIRDLLCEFLSAEGHELMSVAGANDALEVIPSFEPQIVLTDFSMPEVTGIELLKAVRERYPQIRVIILTGYADAKNAIDAVNFGACGFFEKPLEMPSLLNAIQKITTEIMGELREKLDRQYQFKAENRLRTSHAVFKRIYHAHFPE